VSATNGNGKGGRRASLEMLGAPTWYVEGERHHEARYAEIEGRIGTLEHAVLEGASSAGAKAGQKWGAFLGALLAVLSTTLLNQCDHGALSGSSPSTTRSQ